MEPPNFDQFADFIREFSGYSPKKSISPTTLFEKELGITGDDGVELLDAVEKHFGISLINDENDLRSVFGLQPNEYLFDGEGWPALWWFGTGHKPIIHAFTVGELYDVVHRAFQR
ncbi:acyl carrier protein [Spirosoma panaciterrae]|uniref:acyl carrier protein n=1 Tax=Spirosoma panaciterrae TaxID=496058 RepID=UPI000376984B|nr:acyl carrier protein [Spirosoma panaciterrae]